MPQLKSSSKLLAKPANQRTGQLIRAALAAAIVAAIAAPGIAQEQVNPSGAAIKEFLDRAKKYVELQKKEDDGLPAENARNNTSKMEIRQRALAARMRLARPDAKPGDLFGTAGPLIRDVIVKDAQTRAARDKKAAMEEVPLKQPLKINAEYPEKAALATVPPLVLTNLPPLPEGLEYRFMARELILRDTRANLIADFIHEAVPIVKR